MKALALATTWAAALIPLPLSLPGIPSGVGDICKLVWTTSVRAHLPDAHINRSRNSPLSSTKSEAFYASPSMGIGSYR